MFAPEYNSAKRSSILLGGIMRRLVLALGAASLLACGGDSSGPGNTNPVGTWNLATVNGSALPYTAILIAPSYKLEILSDRIVVNSDGTWSETFSYRETDASVVTTTTESDAGTWSQANSTLTITASDGTVSTATISGDRITLSESGFVSVYQRQ